MAKKITKLNKHEQLQEDKNRFCNWLMAAEFSVLAFVSALIWFSCSFLYWAEVGNHITKATMWTSYIQVANFINGKSVIFHLTLLISWLVLFILLGMLTYYEGEEIQYKKKIIVMGSLSIFFALCGPIWIGIVLLCYTLGSLLDTFNNWLLAIQNPITFIPWIAGSFIVIISVCIIVFINKLKKK